LTDDFPLHNLTEPDFAKARDCIHCLRELAAGFVGKSSLYEYGLSLLCNTLPLVGYQDLSLTRRLYAFLSAGMICDKLSEESGSAAPAPSRIQALRSDVFPGLRPQKQVQELHRAYAALDDAEAQVRQAAAEALGVMFFHVGHEQRREILNRLRTQLAAGHEAAEVQETVARVLVLLMPHLPEEEKPATLGALDQPRLRRVREVDHFLTAYEQARDWAEYWRDWEEPDLAAERRQA
jgi:hypothetical protein